MKTQTLAAVNGRLRRDKCRAKVVVWHDRLYLQATLPPAPGSRKDYPHQQRIALGLPATTHQFFSQAERKARDLSQELYQGTFDWSRWRKPKRPTQPQKRSAQEWVTEFERDFWRRHPVDRVTLWKKDYLSVFKKLDGDLTPETVLAVIEQSQPNSRSRKRSCAAMGVLVKFAGIDIDLSPYTGSYGVNELNPRDIPDDRLIEEWWERIEDESWQWTFGIIAAYGLRPHEVMHCHFVEFPKLEIETGKTGRRIVYPILAEWAEVWNLGRVHKPDISGKDNSALGQRIGHAFRRIGIPFPAYALRHAWAIRAIGKIPDAIAAQQMGHSLAVHCRIYHRWASEATHREAFEKMRGGDTE